MHPVAISVPLLLCSNVFMTFAWYAHLKELNIKPWITECGPIEDSAGSHYPFRIRAFPLISLKEPLKLDYLWAGLCLMGAVFFMFKDRLINWPSQSITLQATVSCRGAPDAK
jgi:hypothetical protein